MPANALRTVLLAGGLVLFVYVILEAGPAELLAFLVHMGWGVPVIAALYAGYQGLRAWALRLSVPQPTALAYRDALGVRVSGEAIQFLTSTGPFLAEPSKALLLARRGLTTTEGVAATIGEYLAYTLVSAVLLGGATAYVLAQLDVGPVVRRVAIGLLVVSALFVLVAAVAIANRIYLIGGVVKRVGRLPGVGRRLRAEASDVRRMEDALLSVLRERPGRFALILLVEALAHAVLVAELWYILQLSDARAMFAHALFLESASKFTSLAFFFIPWQLGASEGVYALLFDAIGLTSTLGVGVALARRVRSVLATGVGLAVLALFTRHSRPNGAHVTEEAGPRDSGRCRPPIITAFRTAADRRSRAAFAGFAARRMPPLSAVVPSWLARHRPRPHPACRCQNGSRTRDTGRHPAL